MFVGGARTGAASGETSSAESPATGEAISEVPQGGREDAARAIEAAGRAEQAIELTNASPYGLLAAILTADPRRGLEFAGRVRTGWVNVNESSNYWESHLPFGGRAGSDSGIGRVGGTGPMEAFGELQTAVLT